MLALAAVAVIAVSVWVAADRQRSVADDAFQRIAAAHQMREAILEQSFELGAYVNTAGGHHLDHFREAGRRFESALAEARRETASSGAGQRRLLRGQERTARRWQAIADRLLVRTASIGSARLKPRQAKRVHDALDRFDEGNDRFTAGVQRERERGQAAARSLTVGLILGLSALFGGLAYLLFERRSRREEGRRDRHAGFTEVMQLARTETEAYGIVKRHLERIVPGGIATVLNRNNSANRLEPATPVEDEALAVSLEGAEPEACIAVRSGRAHQRVGHEEELLACEICGATPGSATCMPSLVGGEVIGSVLVQHERRLENGDRRYLETTIAEAAPIIANLRTLAVAELRAATDALTGLPNNRALQETLRRMSAHAGRTATPLAALLFDLDRFKQINDVHGHAKGDEVLAAVGDAVASVVRASDFVGRYGGEEFLALLPDTDREGAQLVALKLRSAISEIAVPGVSRRITASFGVAAIPHDAGEPEQLLREADRALYSAKANGRDRVETVAAEEAALSSSVEDG